MPTPNVYVQAKTNPFADIAAPLRTNTVDVLYATDRQPVPGDDGLLAYGYGRSPSLAVGSCVVEIGQDVSWDTLVEQSQEAERTQRLPLHIRALTEQVRFPSTPMPFVLHNGQPTVAPAVQEVYEHDAEQVRQAIERVARRQIIDARVPTGFLGHAYFYRHPAVSADLVLLLRYHLEPGSPGRPLRKRGVNFWQITTDYPGLSGTPDP